MGLLGGLRWLSTNTARTRIDDGNLTTTMSIALTFPGQGSQSIGMLGDLAAAFPTVEETFAEASEVLGYDLWRLTQEGPEDRLNQTEQTQPAVLAGDIAVLRVFESVTGGVSPTLVAGHSLGEYAALVSAESIEFTTAVSLVATRGRLMQEAVKEGDGAIAAILGLDDETIVQLCDDAAQGAVVSAVNFNAPGQVAVAGHTQGVDRLIELAKGAGAKRAIKLALSVPVHCALMQPAADMFADTLSRAAIAPPKVPVIHNIDVTSHREPERIRRALVDQVAGAVRWSETVAGFSGEGVTTVVELGPGKVLTGLCKRIDRSLTGIAVNDPASLDKALEVLEAV